MIANMIKANDEAAKAQASAIFEAHAADLEKLPAAIRLQILVNQIKHQETKELSQQYLDTYVKTVDGNFKRQLAAALSYTKDEETLEALLKEWKNKDVVKPQDLAMSWYYNFCTMTLPKEELGLGRVKTGIGSRKPSVVI